jgi:hypothetical protein
VALNLVQVSGTYANGSNLPCQGQLKFAPSAPLIDTTDEEVIRQVPLTAELTGLGTFSIPLLATDNANLAPTGWCWVVTECIDGLANAQWAFFLEHSAGASQDISTLETVVVAPVTGVYLPLSGGTMEGPIVLAGNPSGALQAAPKQYVDAETARAEAAEAALGTEIAGALPLLVQTPVKTADYTALASQLVPTNTSAGSLTVTLPDAPAAGTLAGVKQVATIGSATTVAAAGSDVFNKPASGVTSLTLSLLNQGVLLEYNSGVWIVLSDDLPLGSLDGRYVLASQIGADSGVASLNSSGLVPITEGGTGAATAAAALTALGAIPATEIGADSGVAGLNSSGLLPLAQGGTDNATGQPSGTAGGVLTGFYPSPSGLASTGVTPGSYTLSDITVGADGRITAASDGSAEGGSLPLTTFGDLLYENSFPAPGRIAGNTSTTRNFLTQTGTGSESAAPAWGTIATGDVPVLNQNTTGTAGGLSATLGIGSGGSGQTTAQAALNAFAAAVTSGYYLRGNGTNVVLSAIQVADVPALNQSTTGTAANITGTAAILNGGTGQTTAAAALTALGGAALAGATMTGYLAPAVVTLTDASTVAVNAALGNDFRLLMTSGVGSARTLANPAGLTDGQDLTIALTQDSSGSQTVTWGTAYDFGTAGAPTLSTVASKTDLVACKYIASLGKLTCALAGTGY